MLSARKSVMYAPEAAVKTLNLMLTGTLAP